MRGRKKKEQQQKTINTIKCETNKFDCEFFDFFRSFLQRFSALALPKTLLRSLYSLFWVLDSYNTVSERESRWLNFYSGTLHMHCVRRSARTRKHAH